MPRIETADGRGRPEATPECAPLAASSALILLLAAMRAIVSGYAGLVRHARGDRTAWFLYLLLTSLGCAGTLLVAGLVGFIEVG